MTEKTTKTPHPEPNRGASKDASAVPVSKGHDNPIDTPADQAQGPSTTAAKASAATPVNVTAGKDPDKTGSAEKPAAKPKPEATKQTKTPAKPDSSVKAAPAAKTGATADSAKASKGGGSLPPSPPPPPSGPASSPKKSSPLPFVVLGVAVVLLAGGLWYQHATSQQQLAQFEAQARSSADQARQAEQKAQQALDALNQQRDQLQSLRTELQESRTELDGLSTAFQTITDRGSDLVLLNDIDHLVMIAQQQLQLNGNVANAIISLETAQAQLARANRPALASLQQTINGDLDRLRAATTVDIALLSARLDELAGLVSQAPLLIPDEAVPELERPTNDSARGARPSSEAAPASEGDAWWEKALTRTQEWTSDTFHSLRQDLGQFISVRRVDDASAMLISPDQATRFRDSLRQRIMTAQLALMMDQSLIWESETDALLKAIESRFDPQSSVTRQAIRIAREVADTAIDTPMPDVSNSIRALEVMNEQMGRRATDSYPAQPAGAPVDSDDMEEATSADAGQDNDAAAGSTADADVAVPAASPAEQPAEEASHAETVEDAESTQDESPREPSVADDTVDSADVEQG